VSEAGGPTSGTEVLDALIDDVHIGDNLVVAGDEAAPLDLIVDRFVAAARGRIPLVIVTVAEPWSGPVPDGVTVLDWSAVMTGRMSELPGALPPDADLAAALASVRAADHAVGAGAAFVFDRLSAVQAAWSDTAALEVFLSSCPRLYRRRSLALWPVELSAHRPTFLRRLTEVTQVVVEMVADETPEPSEPETFVLTVRKADGRGSEVVGRSRRAVVADGDLQPRGETTSTRQRLGFLIRDQRLSRGLSQAEVARRVGISPSALSQVERGVRGPGGDTLVRLWEVLGVPFGPRTDTDPGYTVSRRSGRERRALQEGLTGERLLDDAVAGELWLIEVAPGTHGTSGPFAVKAAESVTVVRGVLDLTLGGRTETLHEGDALLATDAAIGGWSNPATTSTEVLWHLLPALRPQVPR
jgi:transcriptional regulator with XRE-family HTH domain